MADDTTTHTSDAPRRLFSGMQPSAGSLHLGNYLGALAQWVTMQDTHEAVYSVVDLHAISVEQDPERLVQQTRSVAALYLAAGVDPKRSVLFVQSHVPQHAELAWVLNCITSHGEAARMTQFKDKSGKQGAERTTVGLFTYPILMAADILLYNAHDVPVGDDQHQHVELTRNLAQRFNSRFGETFVIPQAVTPKKTARIMDLQDPTSKMSKSAASPNGLLDMMDDPKVLRKRIKSAVTDTDTVIRYDRENKRGVSNLMDIHSAISGESIEALEAAYEGKMYGHLKVDVADLVVGLFTPIQEEARRYAEDPDALDAILLDGAERAKAIASATLDTVYANVGFLPRMTGK